MKTLPTILKEAELDSKILTQIKLGRNTPCNGTAGYVIHTTKILLYSSLYKIKLEITCVQE